MADPQRNTQPAPYPTTTTWIDQATSIMSDPQRNPQVAPFQATELTEQGTTPAIPGWVGWGNWDSQLDWPNWTATPQVQAINPPQLHSTGIPGKGYDAQCGFKPMMDASLLSKGMGKHGQANLISGLTAGNLEQIGHADEEQFDAEMLMALQQQVPQATHSDEDIFAAELQDEQEEFQAMMFLADDESETCDALPPPATEEELAEAREVWWQATKAAEELKKHRAQAVDASREELQALLHARSKAKAKPAPKTN